MILHSGFYWQLVAVDFKFFASAGTFAGVKSTPIISILQAFKSVSYSQYLLSMTILSIWVGMTRISSL
jgi:hypothetical protein